MRPGRLVVVTGTGTEIGKTWVGCAVLDHLRRQGRSVAARKPAQSFAPGDDPSCLDAARLAAASGAAPEEVCERSFVDRDGLIVTTEVVSLARGMLEATR